MLLKNRHTHYKTYSQFSRRGVVRNYKPKHLNNVPAPSFDFLVKEKLGKGKFYPANLNL